MKIKDITKKPTKVELMLKEALSGEFTFGFELEAICDRPRGEGWRMPGYNSYSDENKPITGGAVTDVKKDLDKYFGEGTIEEDGSLHGNTLEDWTFEYGSPKIRFNPLNMKRLYEMLTDLDRLHIYTNNSCGFHIHFSYPTITKEDIAWIVCCIAIDKKLKNDLMILDAGSSEVLLFNTQYASKDFLDTIETYIKEKKYYGLQTLLNNEKKRVFRIHPQGTLEWRGPRGFLNAKDPTIIKAMIQKIYNFVLKLSKLSQASTYEYEGFKINKKDILSKINIRSLDFDSEEEKKKTEKAKETSEILNDRPEIILEMKPASLEKVFLKGDSWDVIRAIEYVINHRYVDEFKKMNNQLFNKICDCKIMYQKSSSSINYNDPMFGEPLYSFFDDLLNVLSMEEIYEKLNDKNRDLIRNYMAYIIEKISLKSNFAKNVFSIFDVINSDYFKRYMKDTYSNRAINNLMNLVDELPEDIINMLYKTHKYSMLSLIKNVPETIQMKLVKKNPYYIQYIRNPSVKVLNYINKKDPNAMDYVLNDFDNGEF